MHTSLIKKNPYHFIANLDAVLHLKWIHFNCVYTFTHFIFLIESNFNISLQRTNCWVLLVHKGIVRRAASQDLGFAL